VRSKFRVLVPSLLVWAMLTGCASDLSVGTSFDPLMRFPAEATWRFDERRILLPEDERIVALDVGPALRQAITEELAARGYRQAGSETPDFGVVYQLSVTSRSRPEGSFAIGSLSLSLNDARSGKQVWVSFAQTEIEIARDESERNARLRKYVGQMLAEFPPGQGD
jgi:hypothetical protein